MPDRLTVFACWSQARREWPDDLDRQRMRYVELLREQGHVVKRKPGQSVNLPCGWPHRPEPDDVDVTGSSPEPLLCLNCGKTMAEHGPMANCWGGGAS